MSEKMGPVGGYSGGAFDDGVFNGVKKIIVGIDSDCVSYIKIEYKKDGKVETHEHGTIRGELKEFVVDYPSECITSVGGSYDHVNRYYAVMIKSLIFKTSYGRTSPILGETNSSGNPTGNQFMLKGKNGGKLLGFHGRSGQAIDAIGAYFSPVPESEKMKAMGGNMGGAFDDGVFDGVKKIIVGKDLDCVSYIKIEYEMDGKFETREHGTIRGELKEFLVNYPSECITSVGGSYDHVNRYNTVLIKSLIFKTSYGRISPILGEKNSFGSPAGKEFMLEGKNGGKLLGFHGRSGQAIDAIGAYFWPVPTPAPEKMEALGGNMGGPFDDGVYDGVKKIIVGKDFDCLSYIKIEYEKDRKFETREHGTIRGELKEFAVDYPNECITFVGGSYDHVNRYNAVLIKSLIFKTSYGRTSPIFGETNSSGNLAGKAIRLEGKNGGKLLGFHGRSGQAIDAIGAYFWSVPAPEKMEAMGGNMGGAFDDGIFDGVKKITVGKDRDCVSYTKIEYEKDGKVETCEHGTIRGELKEFVVDYPSECMTSVGGSYDHVNRYNTVLIKSLIFKTSYGRTSPIFGETNSSGNPAGNQFMLENKNRGKLLGFHGRSGQAIDAIGAYFSPVPEPEKIEAMGGNMGDVFDDGVFDGVKKIIVAKNLGCVSYIKIEYEKDGKVETREHGKMRGELKEFVVDYPKECITSVGGRYDHVNQYNALMIKSLSFKTSYGRISSILGETNSSGSPAGKEFMLAGKKGGKLLGFHGRSGEAINAIGAYFWPVPTPPLEKIESMGGNMGGAFDDGVFDGVKKIIVGKDLDCVSYIKIEYEKDGKVETREHGTVRGELKEFVVDYPSECVTSVGGSYDHVNRYNTVLVKSLIFKTSYGRTSPILGKTNSSGNPDGNQFMLESKNGGKLLGIHGRSGQAIDAIGVYFGTGSGGP